MKTFSTILVLTFMSIFIISCSISEEITFNANGGIKYSYLFDGSSFMKMAPDTLTKDKKIRDSIISFSSLLEEKKDSISKLPLAEQEKLAKLKPFKIIMHQDDTKKEFSVQLTGDFKNSSDLNAALTTLSNFDKNNTGSTEKTGLLVNSYYDWNGKELKKTSTVPEAVKVDSSAQSMIAMFSGGKFKVKYNFPKKVKKVSDASALISQDGKTVLVEYDATEYLSTPEKTNIKIELEN